MDTLKKKPARPQALQDKPSPAQKPAPVFVKVRSIAKNNIWLESGKLKPGEERDKISMKEMRKMSDYLEIVK